MKTLILHLSLTLLAGSGLANAQSNEPQPAGQTIDGGPPKSQLSPMSPGFDPERSRAAHKELNSRPMPPYVLYYFLFGDLLVSQQSAAEVKSRGKSDTYYQTLYSRQAGLTDDEGGIVNQVALDWEQQQDAINARRQAILDARRAEPNPPKNLLTMDEFSQFGHEEIANTDEHIEQLKSQLGDASFEKLDAYVRARYKPTTPDPDPNPSGKHSPPKGAEERGGPQ
jgi:hypothetical protein